METAFNDLEIACLLRVFAFLEAKDCARASCVHPLWNSVAEDDAVWKPHLAADFAASSAAAPDGSATASYRAAYAAWHAAYADVAGPLLARALACWRRIEGHLQQHSTQILATLNPGATAQQVQQAEEALGHPLPLAVRCIYRVHNGQDLRLHQRGPGDGPPPNLLMGLFGCLIFYDHVTSNAMQSLEEVVKKTSLFRSIRPMGARHPLLPDDHVVFAHSFKPNDKVCVLDAGSGGVYLKLLHNRDWPLAPAADTYPGACDGMLRWMEEYARRLSEGWYGSCESDSSVKGPLEDAGIHVSGAISLFPRAYPAAATAVTRGVQVTWSSVLVPQESRQGRLMFTYSVKFTLLSPDKEAEALQRLEQERQRWQQQQQQQQQQLPSSAGAAGAPAAPTSGAGGAANAGGSSSSVASRPAAGTHRQLPAIGPCDASAGSACVPDTLLATPSWSLAAAGTGAAGSGRSSSSGYVAPATAAPAGTAEEPTMAAGSSSSAARSAPGSAAAPLASCQLETRNWRILDAHGGLADTVSGEGVVGLYPLLVPDGEEFSYASCTPFHVSGAREAAGLVSSRAGPAAGAAAGGEDPSQLVGKVLGAMEGSFTFVQGSMMQRMGPEFAAKCPRLVFAVPEYLY